MIKFSWNILDSEYEYEPNKFPEELNEDDKKVSLVMNELKSKGSFSLNKEQISIIKKDFSAKKTNDKETLEIIKKFSKDHNFILDPHTAVGYAVGKKLLDDSEKRVYMSTAHYSKFMDTITTCSIMFLGN